MNGPQCVRWVAPALGAISSLPLFAQAPTPRVPHREPGRLLVNPHELLAEPWADVLVMALGDVDGDGDLDVFRGEGAVTAGGNWPAPNGLWTNDGTGRFLDGDRRIPAFDDVARAALLVDLTGDARPELLVASWDAPDRLLRNNGFGHFAVAPGALPFPAPGTGFAAADVDGDGDTDLVCGRDGQDRLLLNDGDGVFTDATGRLPADGEETLDLLFADVDGDLDLDLVVAHAASLALYRNDGGGTFSDASTNLPGGGGWVAAGDVDGDLDLDLATSGLLLLNDGAGVFTAVPSPCGADLWDADGDGDLDFLGPETLCLNDGTGSFTDAGDRLPDFSGPTFGWAVGDLDGDGDPDLLLEKVEIDGITNFVTRHGHLVLNDGTAHFGEATAFRLELPERLAHDGAFADLDGDGDLDLVTGARIDGPGGTWEHKFFLFQNDGFGRFIDRTDLLPREWTLVQAVALGDVDRDGDVDIVLGGEDNWDGEGGGCRLFLNEGAAGFSDATHRLPPSAWAVTRDVQLGDVDGDRDLDILQGNAAWPPFADRLFLNDGTGWFTESTGFPSVAEDTYEVAFADVDGDRDLDVLTAGDVVRLFRNDGLGSFTDASAALAAGAGTALAAGDVDGDGDVDVVVGRIGVDELFLNDGAGVFTAAGIAFTPPGWRTDDVALVDLDDDGDLDVLTVGRAGYGEPFAAFLHLNDGAGLFRAASDRLPPRFTAERLAWGDVDEDGDLDVFASSPLWWYGRLWYGLRRHVVWRTLPRVGGTLLLDLSGAPEDPWLLAWALGTTRISVAAGVLFLDPATLVVAGAGLLSEAGTCSFTAAVPTDSALVGLPVHWQAALGAPPRLTNLETTLLTGF